MRKTLIQKITLDKENKMIRLSNLFKKTILQEDWGNLNSVDPEIRDILSRRNSYKIGKNSKVQILRTSAKELFQLMTKGEDNNDDSIVAVIIRYGQEDLVMLKNDSYHYKIEINIMKLRDLDNFETTETVPIIRNLASTIKSESGMVKLCNSLINMIYNLSTNEDYDYIPHDKKEIAKKFNFQIIYKDEEKENIQNSRRKRNNNKSVATVNNVKTPSNYAMVSRTLKNRLEDFLNNRLPQFDENKQLPKDMSFIKKDTKFKLFGAVYKYDDTSMRNIFSEGIGWVSFINDSRYENQFTEYPRYIVFKIGINNNYQLFVSDILYYANADYYNYQIEDLKPIEELPAYIKSLKIEDEE